MKIRIETSCGKTIGQSAEDLTTSQLEGLIAQKPDHELLSELLKVLRERVALHAGYREEDWREHTRVMSDDGAFRRWRLHMAEEAAKTWLALRGDEVATDKLILDYLTEQWREVEEECEEYEDCFALCFGNDYALGLFADEEIARRAGLPDATKVMPSLRRLARAGLIEIVADTATSKSSQLHLSLMKADAGRDPALT
jgi:hypothetical protein